ncbi:hypothetical protein HY448_00555 [Candidatus Pacearchaeota archaeon]|nr:hypothetical protein [Candidatus Pacearchaeota archaeon]
MNVRTKKQHNDDILRLETSGEIREIILNEDFLNPKQISVLVCFRGENSSGIVELTPEEVKKIHSELQSKKKAVGKVKVMKFKK